MKHVRLKSLDLFARPKGRPSRADGAEYAKLKVELHRSIVNVALGAVRSTAQTIRHIYYLCSGQGMVPKGTKGENHVNEAVGTARWDGELPWGDINDGGRSFELPTHWPSADHFLKSVIPQFRLDRWAGQPTRVVLCFEKDTLVGMLKPLCRKWHLPFMSFHGQLSDSLVYELAEWIADQDCRVVCLYLGDYDFHGLGIANCVFGQPTVSCAYIVDEIADMSKKANDIEDCKWDYYGKLRIMLIRFFGGNNYIPIVDESVIEKVNMDEADAVDFCYTTLYKRVEYRRIGIVGDDIQDSKFDQFKLEVQPYNEEGKTNKYYLPFMTKTNGDPRTLGIDALTHEELTERVEAAVRQYIDWDIWNAQEKVYEVEAEKLATRN